MALILRTRGIWPVVAAAGVLTLAGCSQGDSGSAAPEPTASVGEGPSASASVDGILAIPSDADEETKKMYVQENAMAACMRAKGFVYTPYVARDENLLDPGEGKDYDEAKKYREKYGFGLYAGAVYRDDPNVFGSAASNEKQSPHVAYYDSLTPAQKEAYNKAQGVKLEGGRKDLGPGCLNEAREKAYGPEKSQKESAQQVAEEKERALAAQQALNGDPQLVSLAQEYADCLTKAGITVTTTQPTSIGDMVKFQVANTTPPDGILSLDKTESLARLTHEIGLAKKDLVCGKDFRAAYFPKHAKHPFESVTG